MHLLKSMTCISLMAALATTSAIPIHSILSLETCGFLIFTVVLVTVVTMESVPMGSANAILDFTVLIAAITHALVLCANMMVTTISTAHIAALTASMEEKYHVGSMMQN